jgi:hypothetical protein
MDPNTPLTTGPFTQAIWALLIGLVVPWVLIVLLWQLIIRWWDRRSLRRAEACWQAWEAAHPREPPDEFMRRWQIRHQLWLESQPLCIHAHLLRQRLAEAEREEQVQALLKAERRGETDGR